MSRARDENIEPPKSLKLGEAILAELGLVVLMTKREE